MKRFICFIVSIIFISSLVAGCSKYLNTGAKADMSKINSEVIKGNNQFAFDIFNQLNSEDKDRSIFISPLSISTALSMTYQGAEGTTKTAMEDALRYKGIDMKVLNGGYKELLSYLSKADSKVELNINNSIWIKQGEKIKEDFLNTNKSIFNAEATELDFSKADSADKINGWIDKATKGKIQKMIEPPIPQDVIMYLINAIYFKGSWRDKFDKKNTIEAKFNLMDGKVQDVMMMSRNGDVEYGAGEDYKAVRLPYGNKKISMYCILPKEGTSINNYIKSMNFHKWTQIKGSISKRENVILQIPRFKMEYGIKELNDSLTNLGMGVAFTDKADFTGIRDSIYISKVLHKAVIEVNEEGSEAAGVTVVEMRKTSAPLEPINFIADRPFLFVIADDETGSILFMGKLSNIE